MKDYYALFKLKESWSSWRLLRKLEKDIRRGLQAKRDVTDELSALRIFINEKARKVYDLNVGASPNKYRSWPFIVDFIDDTPEILAKIDLSTLFSERSFLASHIEIILNRMFGFDFILNGLGSRNSSGELTWQRRTSQAAMQVYFYFYYGIPILLGYFFNQWFYLLLLPIILIKFYLEYKRVKTEYYLLSLK